MSYKTKAALQGRQCHYQEINQVQHTRPGAGGQSLSFIVVPVSGLTQPNSRLNAMPIDGSNPVGYTNFSAYSQSTQILGGFSVANMQIGSGVFANAAYPLNSYNLGRNPDIGYHYLSIFLAFLRWRRLISLSKATTTNCPVLSPGSFHCSIESAMLCGTLAAIVCDFPLTALVAISGFLFAPTDFIQLLGSIPRCWSSLRIIRLIQAASDSSPSCCWACSISSRNSGSNLNWNGGLPRLSFLCVDTSITLDVMCLCVMTHYIHVSKIATPRTVRAVPRRLTKPLKEVTVMAYIKSTQTRPEFTWRFISTSERFPDDKPLVIYVNARSEQEARDTMPGVNLIFTARLPFHPFEIREVFNKTGGKKDA